MEMQRRKSLDKRIGLAILGKQLLREPIGWLYSPVFQQSPSLFRCMQRIRLYS